MERFADPLFRVKDKENADLREATERLEKDLERKESVIDQYKKEEVGIPFHLWQEERRLLKV